MIFTQQLPEDYIAKSIKINTNFENIELYALHPLDIIVTKIGRMDERDLEDVNSCIKEFGLTKQQIENRANKVKYIAKKENYNINLNSVLMKFFGD